MSTGAKTDSNQNFWQLACIQAASPGLAWILLGKSFAQKYGYDATITSILFANLILWFIAFSIVSMTAQNRNNAIENAEEYTGIFGGKLAALISMAIFPIWSIMQMEAAAEIFTNFYGAEFNSTITVIGLTAAIVISFIIYNRGIRIIRQLTTAFLPILILYSLYSLLSIGEFNWISRGTLFSFPCTFAYVSASFPGMVNLPTFFRHSRSLYDSYLALTIMTLLVIFFQISSLWIAPDFLADYLSKTGSEPFSFVVILFYSAFMGMLLICNNLVNIYFSYPSWMLIIPSIKKNTMLLIVGLCVAIFYGLIRTFPDLSLFFKTYQIIADNFIANLGIVLLIIFGFRLVVRHRPQPLEKVISTTSWIIGCIATILATIQVTCLPPALIGMGATIGFFGLVMFIEEPFWSWKKLRHLIQNRKP
ncbi:MAG: hypothetical protein ACOYK9_00545 [Chlamydiia bacterium]